MSRRLQNKTSEIKVFDDNSMLIQIKENEKVVVSKNDKKNIMLLFFLYVLQGIPIGLAASMPLILQNKNISYKEQAIFSFVTWPFSMKLLWAPIVDAYYISRMGRRKSWLIPVQYLLGIFMLVLSAFVTKSDLPGIYMLTALFFALNFLAATQDIVVDGWALTMLSRENVGYASTCNSVGQTAGYFISNMVFLALESKEFCNQYLRSEPQDVGIVTLESFLKIWAWIFIISTTLVWILKKESDSLREEHVTIKESYQMLYRILGLPSVRLTLLMLLTCKIGFACTDAATGLKLIEAGVPREQIALLAIPIVPLQIILPLIISKYTAGPKPLNVMIKAYPFRLFLCIPLALMVWWTKSFSSHFPFYYYIVVVLIYSLYQVTLYCTFVALMAFFAKVSDPAFGGTYMTLLNTICNLGGNWPNTCALWFIDSFTWKYCTNEACTSKVTTIDGYYVLTIACVIFGVLWLHFWGRKTLYKLQSLPMSAWKVVHN